MKTARVYAELAEFARANGYPAVTDHVAHDWRKNGMLPSSRGLGRTRRAPGRLPRALRDRALQICRYRYDSRIRDLRTITLLLWLDGADIAPADVREALAAIRLIPHRVVRGSGIQLFAPSPRRRKLTSTPRRRRWGAPWRAGRPRSTCRTTIS